MATFDLEDVIQKGVEQALNKNKINGKSITQWAAIGMKAPQWVSVEDRLPEEHPSNFAGCYGTEKWAKGM